MAKKTSPPAAKTTQAPAPHAAGTPQVRAALEAAEGLLRLAPTWVPRSFLMPGRRIKLAPQDVYALGTDRGGIDERWFASTTRGQRGRPPDEGLSYVVHDGKRAFTLREAVEMEGAAAGGAADLGPLSSLARLQQVLRQPRPDPAPHAPEQRPGRQGRSAR